jgi:aldehyde dehydrogenase (NAD+)
MSNSLKFYIDGAWVEPSGDARLPVIDPCTEEPFAEVALGDARDVDRAVAAAKRAFASFSRTSREERIALIRRILDRNRRALEALSCVAGGTRQAASGRNAAHV